jgi:four helix bundle protein
VWQKIQRFTEGHEIFDRFGAAAFMLEGAGMTLATYGKYGQDIRDRTFEFACKMVDYCDDLLRHGWSGRVLAPQLVRCGTSIGANLEEARGGESHADFISKCSIALKEARESSFRMRVAVRRRFGDEKQAKWLAQEAGEIAAILGAIVRNARRKPRGRSIEN